MDKLTVSDPALLASAKAGLRGHPKRLESKWFYDRRGSELFERITGLPEYYPTRTELSILRANADTLSGWVSGGAALVELGAGSARKTQILLDRFSSLSAYLPVDISGEFLGEVAQDLARAFPRLDILPVVADFMSPLSFPVGIDGRAKVAFFPGSTIGNLEPDGAVTLLRRVRGWAGIEAFILGIDLVKDVDVLVRAYDDAEGVTAAFNRNLLHRLNRDAGADFDPDAFRHEARWNAGAARIEMHLVSGSAQAVVLGAERISFAEGESIHTENSHKYTKDSLRAIAERAGWAIDAFLTDPEELFAVAVLVPR